MRPAQRDFRRILLRLDNRDGPVMAHMARVMRSFQPGLFSGGDAADQFRDNLDLERWFRLPKGHERRIHGRSHAGVRIVQEGPTLALALDAPQHPSGAFHSRRSLPVPVGQRTRLPASGHVPAQGHEKGPFQ